MKLSTVACVSFLALFSTACSTAASVSRVNGATLVGRITGNDQDNLYLQNSVGHVTSVPKAEVMSIDHPGNGVAVTGGILAIYGALNIAVGMEDCETMGAAYCTGVFLPAAVGVPMFIWGMKTWSASRSAATATGYRRVARPRTAVLPWATKQEGQTFAGAAVVGYF